MSTLIRDFRNLIFKIKVVSSEEDVPTMKLPANLVCLAQNSQTFWIGQHSLSLSALLRRYLYDSANYNFWNQIIQGLKWGAARFSDQKNYLTIAVIKAFTTWAENIAKYRYLKPNKNLILTQRLIRMHSLYNYQLVFYLLVTSPIIL